MSNAHLPEHRIRVLIADEDAARLAQERHPDVALLDVKMPRGGGPAAARSIKKTSPNTRVLALSAYGDRVAVVEMPGPGRSAIS